MVFVGPGLGRHLRSGAFGQQAFNQRLEVRRITQRAASLRTALLADHAFAVDHHDLRDADAFQLRNAQVSEHSAIGSRRLPGIPHIPWHTIRPCPSVTSSSKPTPSAWNPRGPYSAAELCQHLGEGLAMRAPSEQKLDDDHLALQAGQQNTLTLGRRDGEFLGRTRNRSRGLHRIRFPNAINRAKVAVRIKDSLPHPFRGLNPLDTVDGVSVQT